MKTDAVALACLCLSLIVLPAKGSGQSAQAPGSPLVINGVTIVDVERGALRPNAAITVSGERIQGISNQTESGRAADSARFLDGKGLFVIPGLFDAHVHFVDPASYGRLMIVNGVLFVRDMGGPTKESIALRDSLAGGEILGPEMIATGAMLDGSPAFLPPISIVCTTPEEGREAVRTQVAAGVDQIKISSGLRRDVFIAVTEEARTVGVKAVGHVPESVFIEDAANAGLASGEHLFGFGKIIAKLLGDRVGLAPGGMGTDVPYFLRFGELKGEEFRNALKRISATGMHVCPTLVVSKQMPHLREILSGNFPMREYVSPVTRGMWQGLWGRQPVGEMASRLLLPMERITDELFVSRVPLMVGTDLLFPGVIAGFSVHEEMALWQEAGIPPGEVLRSATVVPAKFMGVSDRLGTIAEGKTASFVLLRANPLDDIHNTDQIEGVVFRGRYFSRRDLDGLLQEVRFTCKQ